MGRKRASIDKWIKRRLKDEPPRSKSLIVTIFGDSVAPRLPGLWLSELISLLRPFGVNERLVRTSGFRLTGEGWLESKREGRRSRYSLTESGSHRVEHAYHRIYDPPPGQWDGNWTLVILNKALNTVGSRVELRQELGWEGFGPLAPGVFLHPCADRAALGEVLERLGLSRTAVVMQACDLDAVSSCSAATLVTQCWDLGLVADRYRRFLRSVKPVLPMLRGKLDPESAFVVQTLLIHSFRRVVLHDPRLPAPLLPEDWPGHKAYALCREIYLRTYRQAEDFLAAQLEDREALAANEGFMRRFGGLDR